MADDKEEKGVCADCGVYSVMYRRRFFGNEKDELCKGKDEVCDICADYFLAKNLIVNGGWYQKISPINDLVDVLFCMFKALQKRSREANKETRSQELL